jgi:hypothetical protein
MGRFQDERGAALASVVLIGILLMIAIIAVLSTVSSHSKNVTDAYSETQAYYAAESGIQATINVLRGNTQPLSPLSGAQSQAMDYERAIRLSYSNYDGDPSGIPRLSRWINYNYTPADMSYPDRVVIGESATTYKPSTGTAYKIDITDMDNSLAGMVFTTSLEASGSPSSICNRTFNVGMTEQTSVCTSGTTAGVELKVTVTQPSNNVNFGNNLNSTVPFVTFSVRRTLASVPCSTNNPCLAPFAVVYSIQQPRVLTRIIRGKIESTSSSSAKIIFDSYIYETAGSQLKLCNDSNCTAFSTSQDTNSTLTIPSTVGPTSTRNFYARMSPLQPFRLRVRSTGYGPNGAVKILEAVLRRNFFDELTPPAAVALIGPPGGFFHAGSSQRVCYTGVSDFDPDARCPTTDSYVPNPDVPVVPPIGVTDPSNLTTVNNAFGGNGEPPPPAPNPAVINSELPPWLQSTEALAQAGQTLRATAQAAGTYYPSGQQPPSMGTYNAITDTWNGVTFCDGSCALTGNGGGILVVTGKLTLQGNFNFKGLIIVTGAEGVVRLGGGTGAIIGNLVVSPYNPNNLAAGFLPPIYDMRGGGTSDFIYSGTSTSFNGQTAISDFILGIVEK